MNRNKLPEAGLLQAVFDRLPGELREALFLVRVEGLRYDEASKRLEISVSEVERRIARALARLDRDLERMNWQEWREW